MIVIVRAGSRMGKRGHGAAPIQFLISEKMLTLGRGSLGIGSLSLLLAGGVPSSVRIHGGSYCADVRHSAVSDLRFLASLVSGVLGAVWEGWLSFTYCAGPFSCTAKGQSSSLKLLQAVADGGCERDLSQPSTQSSGCRDKHTTAGI